MHIAMSRVAASQLSSSLDLLVRLSLGQWEEVNWVMRMSSFGDVSFDDKMRVSDSLGGFIERWRQEALGLPRGGYFGIFSPNVSDEVREMMALSKMLRKGVVEAYYEEGGAPTQQAWRDISLSSELIAFQTSSQKNVSLKVGGNLHDLGGEAIYLVIKKGVIESRPIQALPNLPDVDMVSLEIPAVDPEWLWALLEMGCRAYFALTLSEVFSREGLSAIADWVDRDSSKVSLDVRKYGTSKILKDIEGFLKELNISHGRGATEN